MSGLPPPRARLAVLVHGGAASVESVRARQLTRDFPAQEVTILHREGPRRRVAVAWYRQLRDQRPDLVYILNTAFPGALVGPLLSARHRIPYVLDTGDVVHEMAREAGLEPLWRLPILKAVESLALRRAHAVVVRGSRHQAHLQSLGLPRVHLLRDGYVDPGPVHPEAVEALRQRLGLRPGRFIVGVLGSLVFSPRLRICYGWDLVEALARLRDLPVDGLVIGDGNGLEWLRERAREAGVLERITFAGRIPYADVQPALRLMDIALSTQTNNLPGQVRTTGKLPEYMAAGRFVLASRVGDATLLLPDAMLVEFRGAVDREYPARLAERIREVHGSPELRRLAGALPARARELCSYDVLRRQFTELHASWVQTGDGRSAAPHSG